MGRKIFRWTIGNSSDIGVEILCEAVKSLRNIFKENAEYFVFYNNLKSTYIEKIHKLHANVIDQSKIDTFIEKRGCLWALIPPRIDMFAHEVFMDNDLVLQKPIRIFDSFFSRDDLFFISSGKHKLYGNYTSCVKKDANFNSGIFGIPKGFDFTAKINEVYNRNVKQDHFDIQGIVSCIISKEKFYIIPMNELRILTATDKFMKADAGYHFVRANALAVHQPWEYYKKSNIKVL